MSRNNKSGGGLNKFLTFIGIVDDDPKQPAPAQSFNTASGYGQPEAYTPSSRQRTESRAAASGKSASRRSIPAQGSRSNTGSRRAYDDDSRFGSNRQTSRFEEDSQQDFAPQQRSPRSRSRFEDETESTAPERSAAPVRNPAPAPRPTQRSSGQTLMCTLYTLMDVNPVIKALVRGDTIHMSLHAPDENEERRVLDTLAGAAYALDAQFKKTSKEYKTYLLAPQSVSIQSMQDYED